MQLDVLKQHARIEALRKPDCVCCGLSATTTGHVCVMGRWGCSSAGMVIIGEAPGQAEAKTGQPFMGPAGQLLQRLLDELEIHDYYITNVVKCRPPFNRTPMRREATTCGRTYLHYELKILRPKVVVLLGMTATRYFFGVHSFHRGKPYQMKQWPGIEFVPAWHPAYCLRNGKGSVEQLRQQLENAKIVGRFPATTHV